MKVVDKKAITQVIDVSGFEYIDGRPCFSSDETKVVWAENTAKGKAQIFIGTIIA